MEVRGCYDILLVLVYSHLLQDCSRLYAQASFPFGVTVRGDYIVARRHDCLQVTEECSSP
jgi:hypothetical protein